MVKAAMGINPKGKSLLANTKASTEDVLENYNLLIKAIEKNDKETCKKILDKAQNKNTKGGFGWTPLHEAADRGHAEVVKMLLEVAKDKHPKDNMGWTPLHKAAWSGHPEIVKMILDVEDKKSKRQ